MYIEKIEQFHSCLNNDSDLTKNEKEREESYVDQYIQSLMNYISDKSTKTFLYMNDEFDKIDPRAYRKRIFEAFFSRYTHEIVKEYFDKYEIDFIKGTDQASINKLAEGVVLEYFYKD